MGFGKDGKGVIFVRENASVTLGTLADNTSVQTAGNTMLNGFRMLKATISCYVKGVTAGEIPLLFGICSGELTTGEVNGILTQAGPLGRAAIAEGQIAERPLWVLGHWPPQIGTGVDIIEGFVQNEMGGTMHTIKPRWTFPKPNGWKYFIFNESGATLTTGGSFVVREKAWGVWVG